MPNAVEHRWAIASRARPRSVQAEKNSKVMHERDRPLENSGFAGGLLVHGSKP